MTMQQQQKQQQHQQLKSENRKNAICFSQKRCVLVSFEFVSIGEIDMMNERFQAEVIIESKWLISEDKLKLLNSDSFDPKTHWNPELYIENAHTNVREQKKYAVTKGKNNEFFVTEFRLVKGNFWQRVELENFPVDVQELSIALTTKLGSDEIYFLADPDKFSYINLDASNTFYEQQKWSLLKLVKISETANYEKRKRKDMRFTEIISAKYLFKPPKIVATCYSARKPGFYFLNAYFLVFLITFIAFPVFSIDIKAPHFRLSTSYTILLTSVSFKWVLNNKLPSVSNFTSLDKYQICCISFVCLLTVWHSIVGSFWEKAYGQVLDKYFFFLFGIIFILIQCVLVIWLYIAYEKKRSIKAEEVRFLNIFKEKVISHQKLSFDRLSVEQSYDENVNGEDLIDTDNLTAVVC